MNSSRRVASTPTPPPRPGPRGAWDREPARSRWHIFALANVLLALVCLTYLHTLQAEFIWDDEANITNNVTLRTWDGLYGIWFVPGATQQYYPLMYTSYWLEYHLWGLAPLGYHVVNVLLHALCCLLVWRLLTRLQVPGAWLAAALFAVHPVMVESVAWVTERKNVLSLALALTSILSYLRCDPPEESRAATDVQRIRWNWYALSLVLFALALAAKTVVLTLPPVLLVIYWWKRGRIGLSDVLRLIPFFALAVAAGLVTVYMETSDFVGAKGDEWRFTPAERLLLASRSLWFYVGKLCWPYRIVFFYPRFTIDAGAWWQYLFPLATVATLVGLWLSRARIGRGPLAAALIFAGVVAPALGLINIYYMRYAYVSDHFQYHASIALLALAAAGATLAVARLGPTEQNLARAAAGLLLLVLAARSFQQTRIYDNLETLYRDTIAKNPTGWVAYSNLATHLDATGRYDEALALAREALRRGAHDSNVHNNMGVFLFRLGRRDGFQPGQLDQAIAYLSESVRLDPQNVEALVNLAAALSTAGHTDRAIEQLRAALATAPQHAGAHFELGNLLVQKQDLRQAVEHFSMAAQLRPGNIDALQNLGAALLALGEVDRAIPCFVEVLRLAPDNPQAKANLEQAQALPGRPH